MLIYLDEKDAEAIAKLFNSWRNNRNGHKYAELEGALNKIYKQVKTQKGVV